MKNLCNFSSFFSFLFSLRSDVVRYVFNELFCLPPQSAHLNNTFPPLISFYAHHRERKASLKVIFHWDVVGNVSSTWGGFAGLRDKRASILLKHALFRKRIFLPCHEFNEISIEATTKTDKRERKCFFFVLHKNVLFTASLKYSTSIIRKGKIIMKVTEKLPFYVQVFFTPSFHGSD